MRRIPVMLAAGVVAVVPVALIASSGSAQVPGTTTLHLIEKDQRTVGFGPTHRPRQGDRFGFGSKVSGDDTGQTRGVCTVIGTGQALCTVQQSLSKGTLSVQGLISMTRKASNTPVSVTGGTGAYDGARGTALVSDVNSTTTDIKITLRP